MKPFFSVVIPTLNEEDFLPDILGDLAKQKLKNFEVIIVDAKSKDKTKQKALKFSAEFSLEFCSVNRMNVAYQRNFGAKKAKGEFLIFLDADSRVNPDFTKDVFENVWNKKRLLFLPVLTTDEPSPKNKLIFKVVNSTIKLSQSLHKPLSAGGAIFISRKLFDKLNGFKEDLHTSEDHNLIQRARKIGVKAKILDDVKVVFSLRRVRKEGEAVILYKYILSSLYMMINGEVSDKAFTYEMAGGDKYKKNAKAKRNKLIAEAQKIQRFIKKTSAFLNESLS